MATNKPPPHIENQNFTLLRALNETLEIRGKLSYSEGDQAWTTLRLKKEILQKFPYLKDKQGSFIYLMKVCDSHKELKQQLDILEKKEGAVPIIFMIGKENKQEN